MSHIDEPPECLRLTLPVVARSVTVGRQAAAQFAEEVGADGELLWRVRLATSEAIANVVLHAHAAEDDAAHDFELCAETLSERLLVTVCDRGLGMRARHDSPGMGAGLSVISKTCDHLVLQAVEGGGTCVRMAFRR